MEVEAAAVDMVAGMDKDTEEDEEAEAVITKSGGKTVINSIDVSDPTQSFTAQEWEALRHNGGQAYVMQARECMSSQGG